MRHWKLTPLAVAGALGVSACSDALPTGPDPNFGPTPNELRGLNAEFTRLAQEVPGFGGMFYGEDGKLNVYIAGNRSSRVTVSRAIANRLGGLNINADLLAAEMVIHEGQNDFTQLSRWHEQLRSVLGMDGVVYTDIDEAHNRLQVGVEAHATLDQIQQALAGLEVPSQAVTFEVTAPVVMLKGDVLTERVQPFAGGIQLVFPNPMPGFVSICTLGFNILSNEPGQSANYFVTNSHCTLQSGVVEGTPYYQQPIAVLDPKQLIGIEVFDPPFVTDPIGCPYAPFGFVCRVSDAAIARYVTPRAPVNFGAIYRTEFFGSGTNAGSIEIDDQRTFAIENEIPFPLGGEVLDKMGRTTGWTRGPVTNTCVDVGVAGTNIAMLCQDFVQAAVGGGDSGSPVFDQIGDSRRALLYGILWGGAGTSYVFSAMENLHFELGAFQTH